MKNAFVRIHSIFAVSYTVAAVTDLLPSSVMSFPVFAGGWVAAGVLGIMVSDYSSHSRSRPQRSAQPAATPKPAASPASRHGAASWGCHTVSA